MKRFMIAIVCFLFATVPVWALDEMEEGMDGYYVEQEVECAYPLEELFLIEKQRAVVEELLPEEERLLPYVPARWTEECVVVISRMVWGEARGVSRNEQKLVVWTVINRLEHGFYGGSLIGIVRSPGQFHGYSSRFPVTDEIREMVVEVLDAWDRGEAAKVYPPFARTSNYLFFHGDGRHNWFRERFR